MFSEEQQISTYLSMARTDPLQIRDILQERMEQLLSIEDTTINEVSLKKKFEPFFRMSRILLFGQINFEQAVFELKKAQGASKGVCAKTLKAGDVAWKCESCELDSTCIICQECFEKGNHKGHKVWLKKNVSGCCDCGDPDAWRENGFCTDHQGYAASSEKLLEQLPSFMKQSGPMVFSALCRTLKIQSMNMQIIVKVSGQQDQAALKDKIVKQWNSLTLIQGIMDFLDWAVDVSPAFIHFITDSLSETYFETVRPLPDHACCHRAFISADERRRFLGRVQDHYLDKLINEEQQQDEFLEIATVSSDESHRVSDKKVQSLVDQKLLCTCTALDLTFQVNHHMSKDVKKVLYEFYFKLFQSFKFKQHLGLSFAANFEVVSVKRDDKDKYNLGSIGVQILTIDDIGLMIMQDRQMREIFITTYAKVIDSLVESGFESEQTMNAAFYVLYDFKYLTRAKTLHYVIYETDFLESLLEQLTKLYFVDEIQLSSTHVVFDIQSFKQHLYDLDIHLTKIYKCYLKEVNPCYLERNKKLMSAFISFFKSLDQRLTLDGSKGFFVAPLHRVFSYYFTRLMMHNYFLESEKAPQKPDLEIFQLVFRRVVDAPSQAACQAIIESILRPIARAVAFCHEISSLKWVMHGLFIGNIPRLLYNVQEYYLFLVVSLFQMLVVAAPLPSKVIDEVLRVNEADPWLRKLHAQLVTQSVSPGEYKEFGALFDEKKLRQMLHWELRFLISISVVETPFVYPLMVDIGGKDLFYKREQTVAKVEKLFQQVMKRDIVHQLIKKGGKADIKDLKKGQQQMFIDAEHYSEALQEVADVQKEGGQNSRLKLSLKEDLYSWFDPYFMPDPDSASELHEALQQLQQGKSKLNVIVGDYEASYCYLTPVNRIIAEAVGLSSTVLTLVREILVLWSRKDQTESKVIDDQIGHEAVKLLSIGVKAHVKLPQSQQQVLVQICEQKDNELVKALVNMMGHDEQLDVALKLILKDLNAMLPLPQIASILGEPHASFEESKSDDLVDPKKIKQDKLKDAARAKKEQIMAKFQSKRLEYISKNVGSHALHGKKSSSAKDAAEEAEEIECSFCREPLIDDNFLVEPYGQFAYVTHTKLLHKAYEQTARVQAEVIGRQGGTFEVEEERKSYEVSSDIVSVVNIGVDCLHQTQKTGGIIVKCRHYAHQKCLNNYLMANKVDSRIGLTKKLIGLDFQTFQCPLCKHISNVLVPSDTLSNYEDRKFTSKDFDPYNLISFFSNFLSKVHQNQDLVKQEVLPVDIKKSPAKLLKSTLAFIEHRIHLIDLKGMLEYLKKGSHHQMTRIDYADLLLMTLNTVRLILEGAISLKASPIQDQEMTEYTFAQICHGALDDLLADANESSLISKDLAGLLIKLTFYTAMLCHGDSAEAEKRMKQIRFSLFRFVKLQAVLRIVFVNGKGEVKQAVGVDQLLQISKAAENQDSLIKAMLPFLRKAAAMILTARAVERIEEINKVDEQFIKKLEQILDDNEEFQSIVQYLELDSTFDFLGSKDEEVVKAYESDVDATYSQIEALSIADHLKRFLEDKTQIGSNQQQVIKMPGHLMLMDTYFTFKLAQLPTDFQTLIQEYYKKTCALCSTQPKEACICLLCGQVFCFLNQKCSGYEGMRQGEGPLTFHTRRDEGDSCLFMNTSTGKIIMIEGDRSCQRNSPYLNKFGETFSHVSKKWDNFYMDEQTGGQQAYDEYKRMYIHFSIANEIVKDRSISEKVWRLRAV